MITRDFPVTCHELVSPPPPSTPSTSHPHPQLPEPPTHHTFFVPRRRLPMHSSPSVSPASTPCPPSARPRGRTSPRSRAPSGRIRGLARSSSKRASVRAGVTGLTWRFMLWRFVLWRFVLWRRCVLSMDITRVIRRAHRDPAGWPLQPMIGVRMEGCNRCNSGREYHQHICS